MSDDFHEIEDLTDPALLGFFDLFQTAFDISEQVRVSEIIEILQEKQHAGAKNTSDHFLTLRDTAGTVSGMAWCYIKSEGASEGATEALNDHAAQNRSSFLKPGVLWYLAIDKERRGQQLGSKLYREILRQMRQADCHFAIMEVERPDVAALRSEEAREDCYRRNRFYQKYHGAKKMEGIYYLQGTGGWQPPIEMDIMIQPLQDVALDPEAVFAVLQTVFGEESIQKTAALSLSDYCVASA